MTATGWIILALVVVALLIALAAWFHERATNEVSFVRTGVGGRKVVIDGGVLALPFFHEISRVNMQTIRMDVARSGESALITRDRMRIDVGAEFYASVIPEEEAIARAAQTLGRRTFQPDQLKALIDGMMVDALRAVAAQMSMDELHENRSAFVREVREALKVVLGRYGLQLDSVALTALDQTPFSALDENNAFNAEGMRKLAEVIAKSKKERAEIEGEAQVAVRRAEVEANRRTLEVELEQRRAEFARRQEIETLLALQLTEVARRKAAAEREATEARIEMERAIQAASLTREQAIREAGIAQAREIEIAEQERVIQTAAKSLEESRSRAEATEARAALVEAEEAIATLKELAAAERRRKLALVAAQQEAEAETLRIVRQAEADGEAARIAAENGRSPELAAMEMEKARLEAMPAIVAQMVKPVERIKGISINHVSGIGRGGWGSRSCSARPLFAAESRKRRLEGMQSGPWFWLFMRFNGERHPLGHAVDCEGEVPGSFVTKTRDKKAPREFS